VSIGSDDLVSGCASRLPSQHIGVAGEIRHEDGNQVCACGCAIKRIADGLQKRLAARRQKVPDGSATRSQDGITASLRLRRQLT
jgi:hypothetical protein